MNTQGNIIYHAVAFATVAVWGSTFVFTKMLLTAGLSPAQIFTLRFLIAYVLLVGYELFMKRQTFRLFCHNVSDETTMVVLGLTGGSLYFLTENTAMLFTTATNTSLIVCSCPLFAMLLVAVVYRKSEHITRRQAIGSLTACLGMAAVVLNGRFVLHLSPVGDALAFAACLCWAVYSLLMKRALERYPALMITRKVFFYGLLTIVPYYVAFPVDADIFCPGSVEKAVLFDEIVILNLLFLGVIASMVCFLVWNWVIKRLGAVTATNWVYCNPLTTILFASTLLGEQITPWFLLGTALIIGGMYLCER